MKNTPINGRLSPKSLRSKRLECVYSERIPQGQKKTKDRERKDAKTAKKRKGNAIVTGFLQSISPPLAFLCAFAALRSDVFPSVAAEPCGDQYRGSPGSISTAHASMPPAMLWAEAKPCWRSHIATRKLRPP